MRIVFLPSFAAMAAVVVGCGSQGKQTAPSLPKRDLTLASQANQVAIASPVELGSLQVQQRAMRPTHTRRPKPSRRSTPVADRVVTTAVAAAPAVVLTVARPVAQPEVAVPANDRELLPGKTVTVIPASSGPSAAAEPTDEFPTFLGGGGSGMGGGGSGMGGGGRCPGRGPGIGIAGTPSPDFR
jgi:hypothetical protein